MRKKMWSPLFHEALLFAVDIHKDDYRKGTTIPYVTHTMNVCSLVIADGGNEEEAIAALLHDALEDHPEKIKCEDIESRFGQKVLDIVEACTDTPPGYAGGPKVLWKDRKTAYLEKIGHADPDILRVSLANKLDNARSILADYRQIGEELWKRINTGKEEQLWYYRSVVKAFREAGVTGHMIDELDRVIGEIIHLAGDAADRKLPAAS